MRTPAACVAVFAALSLAALMTAPLALPVAVYRLARPVPGGRR